MPIRTGGIMLTDPYFNQFSSTRWVAQYNTCTYKGNYMMWQCTSNGKIDGITTNSVDINMIYTARYGLRLRKNGYRFCDPAIYTGS